VLSSVSTVDSVGDLVDDPGLELRGVGLDGELFALSPMDRLGVVDTIGSLSRADTVGVAIPGLICWSN